jgi:predicted GTPase
MSQLVDSKFLILKEIQRILRDENSLALLQPSGPSPDQWTSVELNLKNNLDTLDNVYSSAEDIQSGKSGVRLVGFLGHFSSGKSSLINALLDVKKGETPGYARKTDSHPTDTGISFITHQNDVDEVRNRKITSVQKISVIHGPSMDFLKSRILVDTPGLGNEAGEHELAEKILHLCHVVILTIDGSLPFAHKDDGFNLLDKAINRLRDVPKIFAITKSSSFLTSRKGEFEKDWDEKEANDWWEKTLQRIFSDARFSSNQDLILKIPKVFVDSPERFHIDSLKKVIVSITDEDGQGTRVYFAQVDYLVSTAKKSLSGILSFLNIRVQSLNEFYEQAEAKARESQVILSQVSTPIDTSIKSVKDKIEELKKEIDPGKNILEIQGPDEEILKAAYFEMKDLEACLHNEAAIAKQHAIREIKIAALQFIGSSFKLISITKFSKNTALDKIFRTSRGADLTADETTVSSNAKAYFKASVRKVIRDLKYKYQNENSKLTDSEFEELVAYVRSSISGGIGQYTRSYATAARSFSAYVMQPSSKRVLLEYGLVLFSNDNGKTDGISEFKPSVFDAYKEVERVNLECTSSVNQLKQKHGEELLKIKDLLDFESDGEIETSSEDIRALVLAAGLGQAYKSSVSTEFDKIETLIKHTQAKLRDLRLQFWRDVWALWKIRFGFLLRVGLASIFILAISRIDFVTEFIQSHYVEIRVKAVAGVIVAVVFALLTYVISGTFKLDFLNIIKMKPQIWFSYLSARRKLKFKLADEVDSGLDQLGKALVSTGQVSEILKIQIQKWFQRSELYPKVSSYYKSLFEISNSRFQLLQKYSGEVYSVLPNISKEVRLKTDENRNQYIEEKMKQVRSTKETIEKLRKALNTEYEKL